MNCRRIGNHALRPGLLLIAIVVGALVAARSSGWSEMRSAPNLTVAPSPAGPVPRPGVLRTYGGLALQFEANRGQTDSQVKFLTRGFGYAVFLTPREAVLVLRAPPASDDASLPILSGPGPRAGVEHSRKHPAERGAAVVRLNLVGANPEPEVEGLEPLSGKVNYFIGNEPGKWRTAVPTYAKVKYRDVYPGVDLVYYGAQRRLEYDFIVAPGADPARIRLAVSGVDTLRMDATGDLVLRTSSGALRLHKPLIYQEVGGVRREVAGNYVLRGRRQAGIRVAAYDARRPLVIDPGLSYSTYLGGSAGDYGYGIAVDAAGNAYVTGLTASSNFPTAHALQATFGGYADAFVAKLNAAGSALLYSTYLGGSDYDVGHGIAADSAGNAYVTGDTSSTNFPTVNALQPVAGGNGDAFVAKLSPDGSALVYSTYLGGAGGDGGYGIAVDSAGNAYVTGGTSSTNFPTANALQPVPGGNGDAFAAKLDATGAGLVYSTYLGGSGGDAGSGIAVDSAGNAYVTGGTSSTNFPTANALQPMPGGNGDTFVAKLDAAGTALVYSTYLGGTGEEAGFGIAVDSAGNTYVTGRTASPDFPMANPFQPTVGGSYDAFVTKLNATGTALVYSTYLGGRGPDAGYGIGADGAGHAYVTGETLSADFPLANAFQPNFGGNYDAFVTKLDATGSALAYSSYLGGVCSPLTAGGGIAVDSTGDAHVTGYTAADNFPTVNAIQPTFGGYFDAFAAKIIDSAASTTLTSSPNPALTGQRITFTATVSSPGGTPTGTVTFTIGCTTLGSSTLNAAGQATLTKRLFPGAYSISAVYGGDGHFPWTESLILSQSVNPRR
jgi:Bacterial Ig-like domain (group 3)/Beta-propeller repeat